MNKILNEYTRLKAKHPDAVLLFRNGDFYEVYEADAVNLNEVLGLVLTTKADGVKVAGFPYCALDTNLPKMVRNGMRVCICDSPY